MQLAIFSDIHANIQAFRAVLEDAKELHADRIVCNGDLIGYGPSPLEVLILAQKKSDVFLMGDIEAGVAGINPLKNYDSVAQKTIKWLKTLLLDEHKKQLTKFPFSLANNEVRIRHSDFCSNTMFEPIEQIEVAKKNFLQTKEQVLFVGHTHIPGLYVLSPKKQIEWIDAKEIEDGFEINHKNRYIINTGSVGDSRDGDPRASYCLYDIAFQRLSFRRVPFDLDQFCQQYMNAGLPIKNSSILNLYLKKQTQANQDYRYLKEAYSKE